MLPHSSRQKVVFLGEQSVGKTSIINRFINDQFDESQRPTIGIDFLSKPIHLDGRTVKLQLWDTAGQERFRSLIPSYIRDCNVALIVFDIKSYSSFQNVGKWFEEVKNNRGKDVLIFLVGNKMDLFESREVSKDEAEAKATEMDCVYFEVSAKNGDNIQNLFKSIATLIPPSDSSNIITPTSSMSFSTAGLLKKSETVSASNQSNVNILGNQNIRTAKSEIIDNKNSKTIVLSSTPPVIKGNNQTGQKPSSCC